ncbi:hypothetical protein [Streptomyces sp. SID1121]|uniref:hypothetical protein n=1 Tax=Streptomyces sp. SID1121 TaxID=3425888 RepID=UPI0040574F63
MTPAPHWAKGNAPALNRSSRATTEDVPRIAYEVFGVTVGNRPDDDSLVGIMSASRWLV